MRSFIFLCIFALTLAQGPGNGVSKTTYASDHPFIGLAFNLKYLPVTAAYDSGNGNVQFGSTYQGRAQLILPNMYSERNCQLFSAAAGASTKSGSSAMTAPASLGSDCSYTSNKAYDTSKSTLMWNVYAHEAASCCKACAATAGCTAATYNAYSASAEMGTLTNQTTVGMPMQWEGFGLHIVNVYTSKTTGGINVSALEDHYTARMGDYSEMDAFMDYNVVLWCGDLAGYAKRFAADGVKFLTGSWEASSGDTWYSLIVQVPQSQMILELVGKTNPLSGLTAAQKSQTAAVKLEARISPRQVSRFDSATGDVLYAIAVSRAVSNMESIVNFYENIVNLTNVHNIKQSGLTRNCYAWTGAKSDVCFTQRTATTDVHRKKDASFSVADLEAMIWSVHKTNIASPSENDKYNDNHYAVDLMRFDGGYIAEYFTAHEKESFPINYPTTQYAWACMQDYIIDPTGWSIQSDIQFSTSLPGCSD